MNVPWPESESSTPSYGSVITPVCSGSVDGSSMPIGTPIADGFRSTIESSSHGCDPAPVSSTAITGRRHGIALSGRRYGGAPTQFTGSGPPCPGTAYSADAPYDS